MANTKKIIGALTVVTVLVCTLAFCSVDAFQVQVPANMPFGEVGSSSAVMNGAQQTKIVGNPVSFDVKSYASESAAMDAINNGDIYGAYITGTSKDTLLTVPSRSFIALTEVVPIFTTAAKQAGRQVTVKQVKPLPQNDNIGAVIGLLVLPTVVGGLLAGLLLMKSTAKLLRLRRVAILVVYCVVGALLVDVIAGPILGAVSTSHFLALWLCFSLVTLALALPTAALLFLGPPGALVAFTLFITLGMVSGGAGGSALLPTFWQDLGSVLPPRFAANLYRNVVYFDSNNISTPIIGLAAWALIGLAAYVYCILRARAKADAAQAAAAPAVPPAAEPASDGGAQPRPLSRRSPVGRTARRRDTGLRPRAGRSRTS